MKWEVCLRKSHVSVIVYSSILTFYALSETHVVVLLKAQGLVNIHWFVIRKDHWSNNSAECA